MTIKELASQRVSKIRKPYWADTSEYIQIDSLGRWGMLHSPNIMALAKSDDPQTAADFQEVLDVSTKPLLLIGDKDTDWEAYQ